MKNFFGYTVITDPTMPPGAWEMRTRDKVIRSNPPNIMELCQHRGMYMKPFFARPNDAGEGEASCEFCGKTIARVVNGKWGKVAPDKSISPQALAGDVIEDRNPRRCDLKRRSRTERSLE
jgi:hypothetical protein